MQSRKYYEAYWSQYDDVVTLNEFRKMLGGLGEVQARRLLQNKTVKSFKIRGEYHIPKQCVIDYVLSSHYAKYRQILKAQIPEQKSICFSRKGVAKRDTLFHIPKTKRKSTKLIRRYIP